MRLASRARALIVAVLQESGLGWLSRRYGEDRAALLAGAIAYNALFAMFPIIVAILAIIGFFLRDPAALDQARSAIIGAFPPTVAGSVLEVVEGIEQSAGLLGVIGLVGLLWAGSGLFGTLEVALNQVYRVRGRSFVRQKLMAAGMIFIFAFLLVLVVAASSLAQFVARLARAVPVLESGVAFALSLVPGLIALLAAFALCFAIYYVVPNVPLTIGQVFPGSLFASLTLVLLTQVFPVYAVLVGGFAQYGAVFGLLFLLLAWSYLVAGALLLGAEINALVGPVPPESEAASIWSAGPEGRRPAA